MTVDAQDVVRVIAKMTDVNGSLIENVYFYKNQGAGSIAAATFLTDVEAAMTLNYTEVEAFYPNTVTPLEIEVDKVEYSGGKLITTQPVGTIDWTTWLGGTSGGEGLPQGAAAVINFPTGVSGVVGRKYLGPFVETAQADGTWVGAMLSDLTDYAIQVLLGFTSDANTIQTVLMSSKQAGVVSILGSVIRSVVGYQRRRKQGRGA